LFVGTRLEGSGFATARRAWCSDGRLAGCALRASRVGRGTHSQQKKTSEWVGGGGGNAATNETREGQSDVVCCSNIVPGSTTRIYGVKCYPA
jgi:hypothetical protein